MQYSRKINALFYIISIIISGLSILFIILSAFSGNSKYSMLGCIRIISQLISFELIWTTILSYFIWSLNEISIAGFAFIGLIITKSLILHKLYCFQLNFLVLLFFLYYLFVFYFYIIDFYNFQLFIFLLCNFYY